MKKNRNHLAVGIVAVALVGGLTGTALAASNMPGHAKAQQLNGPARNTMMNSTTGSGQGTGMGMGVDGWDGMAADQAMPMSAVATYLGLSQNDLQSQLHAGHSLTDVAVEQGKSIAGLKDALTVAMTAWVTANTTMTSDQKTMMLAHIGAHVDMMVDGAGSGMHEMHAQMGAGMHSFLGNALTTVNPSRTDQPTTGARPNSVVARLVDHSERPMVESSGS